MGRRSSAGEAPQSTSAAGVLDDIAAGGSAPYVIPTGTPWQPGGFLVLFRDRTRVALNNDGDTVRLPGPDAAEVDTYTYAKARNDRSYSRTTDGDGSWTDTYPPSPGSANSAPTPTPTPTATPTCTPFPGLRNVERAQTRPAAHGLGPGWGRQLCGRVDRDL